MSPNFSGLLHDHHVVEHPHLELEDNPKVAAVDDGGPPIDPGRLTEPVDFAYEVSLTGLTWGAGLML